MKRVAYFGTEGEGVTGHYFKAIVGDFTQDEIKEIEQLDCYAESIFNGNIKFKFFTYKNYLCFGVPVSPDDKRGGSKTIALVENAAGRKEVLEVIESSPFLKIQFNRISEIYSIQISQE